MGDNALIIRPKRQGGAEGNFAEKLWLRLNAFLSTRSPNTQLTYTGILAEWCRFLGADPGSHEAARRITAAEDLHAIAYLKWLGQQPGERPRMGSRSGTSSTKALSKERRTAKKKEGLESTQSNATIWKKFAALRRMYRVLISANLGINQNPFDTDKVPPPPKDAGRKRPTEMLDFELVGRVLSMPDVKTPKGLRDRAILATLFGGGLRRSEVAGLRIGDVKVTQSGTTYLYLRSTKAKKDAEQALPPWTADAIQAVIKQRLADGAVSADYLFVSYRGPGGNTPTNEPVSHSGIYRLFKQYCVMAGAGAFITPHSARATAITKLLDDGLPHRLVQEFSRHASVSMVELYDKRRIGVDENPAKLLKFK